MSSYTVQQRPRHSELPDGVEIRRYLPSDETAVVELIQAAFQNWACDVDGVTPLEFFRWKMACPFGPAISLIAETDARVIGFAAMLPWRLSVREQSLTTVRGVDLAVERSQRRRGISIAIMRAAMEQLPGDVAFTWHTPNESSRGGLLKTARRSLVPLPRFVQVHRALPRKLGRAYGKGTRTPERLTVNAEKAGAVLGDEARVTELLAHAEQPAGRLTTARDLDYLRWRYGRLHDYWGLADDGGILIFGLRRRGPFWVAVVGELLVADGDPRLARRLLRRLWGAAPVDFIRCAFPSPGRAARQGFFQTGETILVTRPVRLDLVPDPNRRRSWALSLGDLERL